MQRREFWKYLTRAHRWAGLILGVQITLWFVSGFFMSLFPIDSVRGSHLAEKNAWTLSSDGLMPIEIAMTTYDGDLTGAKLISIAGQPAYVLIGTKGTTLINALTGKAWEPVTKDAIRTVAASYYKGGGAVSAITRLTTPVIEYRRNLPVWQVQYNDPSKTRLYIDADTAELRAVRTRLWRIYDVMWMLHIMDYKSRDNFNSWWLRLFAGAALLFALSGLALVVQRTWLRPKSLPRVS